MGDSQEEEFYAELDQKTKPKRKFCTCYSLGAVFGVLFILTIVGVYWVVTKVKERTLPVDWTPVSQEVLLGFENKLKDIRNQLQTTPIPGPTASATVSYTPNDSVRQIELTITSAELTALLQSQVVKDQSFPLKNPVIKIYPDRIDLSGILQKPFSVDVVLGMTPKVEAGKVVLDVTKVSAGAFQMPEFIVNQIKSRIQSSLDAQLDTLVGFTVTEVLLGDDGAVISGTIAAQ